jgi:hypothetical protein
MHMTEGLEQRGLFHRDLHRIVSVPFPTKNHPGTRRLTRILPSQIWETMPLQPSKRKGVDAILKAWAAMIDRIFNWPMANRHSWSMRLRWSISPASSWSVVTMPSILRTACSTVV